MDPPVPRYDEAYIDRKVDRGYGHDSDAKFNAAHGVRPELPPDMALAEMTARGDFEHEIDRLSRQLETLLQDTKPGPQEYDRTHDLLKEFLSQPPPALTQAVPTGGHLSTASSVAYEPVYRASVPSYDEWVRLASSGP